MTECNENSNLPIQPNESKKPLKSYADVSGPWETRRISILGAARSIITQLKNGQDMTRISLPAVFLAPVSMLEVAAHRFMSHFPILHQLKDDSCALTRMMTVTKWFLACNRDMRANHKPYNPVINETHQCSVEYNNIGATFISEQVCHHPPTTSIYVSCPELDIKIEANNTFCIKFLGNSASCESEGWTWVTFANEVYRISQSLPNLMIANVILGTRYAHWYGDIDIECQTTGYHSELKLSCLNLRNWIDGSIYQEQERGASNHDTKKGRRQCKWTFSGYWMDDILIAKPQRSKNKSILRIWARRKNPASADRDENEVTQRTILNPHDMETTSLIYPKDEDVPQKDSLRIWADVSEHIVIGDLVAADEAKKAVENMQREHFTDPTTNASHFFVYEKELNFWRWNGKLYAQQP